MWETIASGNAGSIPDINLPPGGTYYLTINTFVPLPEFPIAGLIYNGLRAFGVNVQSVDIVGSEIRILFYT